MSTLSTSKAKPRPGRLKKATADYHHGQLREALLTLARKHLAAGHEEIGLRELAAALGVTPNAVYRHFRSKDAMLAAVAREGFLDLTRRTRAALAAPGAAPLEACANAYLSFAQAQPAMYRLMFGRGGRFPDEIELTAAARECFDVMASAVASVLPASPKSAASPLKAAVTTWALMHGYAMLRNEGLLARLPTDDLPGAPALIQALCFDARR
jgi:AcrR family transcriptional regulator